MRPSTAALTGDWPHTRRPLPWLVAVFLTMLWLLPIDAIQLKIPLPVDPMLDRIVLAGIVLAWILFGARERQERRPRLFAAAASAFVAIALISVALNVHRIVNLGEFDLAQKRLALLLAFVTFSWFVAVTVRPSELRGFVSLLLGLATLTALGTIVERHTGYNVFYEVSKTLFSPIADVLPAPTNINPDPERESRLSVVGPTEHGLALTTMMAIAVPFAVVRLLDARELNERVLYAGVIGIVMAGALSTERKTGIVAPLAALITIICYRPRALIQLAPVAVVLGAFIHAIAPGALGTIEELTNFMNTDSTQGRTEDYPALRPDIVTRPALGRGYGTMDTDRPDIYRTLDNEYLGQLFQVGFLGLGAYLAMIAAALALAHVAIRSGNPLRASPALGAAAGCAAFAIASLLFDILSFPQAPYMFFFVAALCVVARSGVRKRKWHEQALESPRVAVPA